jgi:hypothetical protein
MYLLALLACGAVRADQASGLVLNELLAVNTAEGLDEAGEADDWLEIWNGGEDPVSLADVFLSDDPAAPTRWPFPADISLEPGDFLVVWCDGQPEQGAFHAPFKLSGQGESIVLSWLGGDAPVLLDQVDYGARLADTAWARVPDGGVEWVDASPTPGESNG